VPIKINLLDEFDNELQVLRREYIQEERAEKVIIEDLKLMHKDIRNIIKFLHRFSKDNNAHIAASLHSMFKRLEARIEDFASDEEKKKELDARIASVTAHAQWHVGTLEEVKYKVQRLKIIFNKIKEKHDFSWPKDVLAVNK
jgi:hypothetical protein